MDTDATHARARELAEGAFARSWRQTDRVFAALMVVQFVAVVLAAWLLAPNADGAPAAPAPSRPLVTVGIAALLTSVPVLVALRWPGTTASRHAIAAAQVLISMLLVHLTGGRTETHFHLFGSLAFLALYRDWKVLASATGLVIAEQAALGSWRPQSVFGVEQVSAWRVLEHAGWLLFADAFLMYGCVRSAREVRATSQRQAELEAVNASVELRISEQTRELGERTDALQAEIIERKLLEMQLVESQKLESIGQLAAGIAHEINTPAQYVGDNTRFLREQFGGIMKALDAYAGQLAPESPPRSWEERADEVRRTLEDLDFAFLREEIPHALDQSLEGIERITQIVVAMKDFSHPGTGHKEPADLNRAIESTATVCKNRWKYAAELELSLDPAMPPVPCMLAEFNQVVLNLIVNAADAIAERFQGTGKMGLIRVESRADAGWAEVRVIDNGGGIPDKIRDRIFDPFFTTKEVGKGTGQGLAISRDVVVKKHGGELRCESTPGEGTVFTVRIPTAPAGAARGAA